MLAPTDAMASAPPAFPAPVRYTLAATLFGGILAWIILSWHWPLIWDMSVMHYVSFLIDRGWAPYRQIGDMNLPGAYLMEGWALAVFGSSDLGWRFYDFTLAIVLTCSAISMARRYDWRAGLLAGLTFTLAHAADGPRDAGQRDQVIGVLMMLSCSLLLESVRLRKAWLAFFFAFAAALAASIKPFVAPFGLIILAIALAHLRRQRLPIRTYIIWSIAGFATVTGIVLAFLLRHQALGDFLNVFLHVLPHYSGILVAPMSELLWNMLPLAVLCFAFLGLLVYLGTRPRQLNWEQAVILIGLAFSLFNYFAQRKGFVQHRYPLMMFILLWASLQILPALQSEGQTRTLARIAVLLIVFGYVPWNIWYVTLYPRTDLYRETLIEDLRHIGPEKLQHNIQCLDIVDGCLNALYQLRIEQSNGSTGDLLLFLPQHATAVDDARVQFWKEIHDKPPAYFILSNDGFGEFYNFDKIDTWPQFANYLQAEYTLSTQREFYPGHPVTSSPGLNQPWPSYRIYIRKGPANFTHQGFFPSPEERPTFHGDH